MKPFFVRVGRKTVSTSGSRSAFAWAIWSSYSKSVAARRPRTMTRALLLLAELDEQTVERLDRHVGQVGRDARHEVDPLLHREERAARRVAADPDDDVAEERRGALDEVEVPERGRVEAAGVDGQAGDGAAHRELAGGWAAGAGDAGGGGGAGGGCGRRRRGGGALRRALRRAEQRRVGLDPHEAPVVGERDAEEREEVGPDDAAEVDVDAGS